MKGYFTALIYSDICHFILLVEPGKKNHFCILYIAMNHNWMQIGEVSLYCPYQYAVSLLLVV